MAATVMWTEFDVSEPYDELLEELDEDFVLQCTIMTMSPNSIEFFNPNELETIMVAKAQSTTHIGVWDPLGQMCDIPHSFKTLANFHHPRV